MLVRYSNRPAGPRQPQVDAGEVAAGRPTSPDDPDLDRLAVAARVYVPFVHLSLSYLLHGQTQSHNRVAGETLRWYPTDGDTGRTFALVHPDGTRVRLGLPERPEGRPVVTATDTPSAGVYRICRRTASTRTIRSRTRRPMTKAAPFAVVPDLRESEDLKAFSDAQLDERLGHRRDPPERRRRPGHRSAGSDRFNREWTMRLLAVLLGLVLLKRCWRGGAGRPTLVKLRMPAERLALR